jgi:hypothetical protein
MGFSNSPTIPKERERSYGPTNSASIPGTAAISSTDSRPATLSIIMIAMVSSFAESIDSCGEAGFRSVTIVRRPKPRWPLGGNFITSKAARASC